MRYVENFRVNHKTEMCKNLVSTGKCEFEGECTFAHSHHELQQKTNTNSNKNYKTKLCKKWHKQTPGQCPYGDKCQFVHDEFEHLQMA